MVKAGAYTVELVAADTKKPFKEHTASDGQVYAEVEPDMDYYIALNSDVKDVMMSMYVDGVDLGYDQTFECLDPSSMYQGKWETTKDGKETMTALHFNKTRQEAGTQSTMLTGKVEVKIYSLGEMYYSKPRDFVSTSLTADSTLGGKKCIKTTTSGSHSFDDTPIGQTASTETVEFDYGEHLQTITLNYCSAFGLIYHKILPPPPDLLDSDDDGGSTPVKKERPTMKRKSSSYETTTPFSAARRASPRRKTTFQNDNEVQIMTAQTKTYDIVDLTGDE